MTRRVSIALIAACTACTAFAPPLRAQIQAQREEIREDIEGRDEWFWAQRTWPFAERPYAQMSLLHQRLLAHLSAIAASASATSAPFGGAWRPIGPTGLWVGLIESGRIASILPPLTPGGPMYAGTASGGVWRSNDAGLSWTPLTDNECGLTTGALGRDPADASIVYAATGEGNGGLTGCGVLRSADGGNTWTTSSSGLRSSNGGAGTFTTIMAVPNGGAPATVLLGTTNFTNAGVVRSTDAGVTWRPALTTGPANGLVAHPTHAGTYYVGNRVSSPSTSRGVYRSTDAGVTWAQLPAFPNIDVNAVGRIELAMSPAAPNLLWALVGDRNTGGMLGLFRFDENTSVWTQLAASGVSSNSFGTQQTYDLVLAVDPRGDQRIYIAGVRAFRSLDGGATFQAMGNSVHTDWHVLMFDPATPDVLWVGTDGGVYRSTDAGDTWVSRSAGLSITQFYPGISVHPAGTRVSGGSQDNGTHTFTGSDIWDSFLGADGGYTVINYRDPTIQWGETQWSVSSGTVGNLFRRDAITFVKRSTGINTGDRAQFIPPLVIDPVNPAKLYFGTYRLYRTTNDGVSWTALSGDLSTGVGAISTINVSPADTNTVWVGTSDGRALVSRDGGVTFTAATGLPTRSVTRVVPHPTDPLRALVTVSGFGTAHIFETRDAFATAVTSINGTLIDAPANVALYMPAQGSILVGTDVGVFQTGDNGATWTSGPTGLPNVIVYDLVYQPTANLLVAGTYGRGMFAYDVGGSSAVLRGDVNGDAKIDASDALLVQQALVGTAAATTTIYPRGDANCNGHIDAADVVLILRAAVGLPTTGACVGTSR